MRKLGFILTMLALFLCSCAGTGTPAPTPATEPATTSAPTSTTDPEKEAVPDIPSNGMWQITLLHAESTDNLSSTTAVVQYNGEVFQRENKDAPQSGNLFVILELSVKKIGSGSTTFMWKDATIEDANGKRYARHGNDTFLENYNLPRLKATDLKIGANKGFVCYEIPAEATTGALTFVYEGADGPIRLSIAL